MREHIDPVNSTSPDVTRRTFIGVTATAGAATAIAPALAAADDYGKAHSPIVPEDDPAIATERPILPRDDGNIDAYAAHPKNAGPKTPGVVVAFHIWAIDTQMRDVARRLAKAGYVAIVPDLFGRWNPPSGDGATDYAQFRGFLDKLSDDQVDKDLAAGASWIRGRAHAQPLQRPPKIGVLGFCMGGSIALRAAVDDAAFDAAAVFYGKVRYGTSNTGPVTTMALAYSDEIRMPVVGSWGGRDTSILADDVRTLDRKLSIAHDFKIYDDAGHGFFDDQRASYNAAAAQDAWKRTLAWFGKYLTA
jgi:carboxymethylenebutenolidase